MSILPTTPKDIREGQLVCVAQNLNLTFSVEIVTPSYARLSDGNWYSKDNLHKVVE
jgi:predicted lysophospholipase L1 biosynthesis ABC-type transport system permease subunit